jgi:hypothetical protein
MSAALIDEIERAGVFAALAFTYLRERYLGNKAMSND